VQYGTYNLPSHRWRTDYGASWIEIDSHLPIFVVIANLTTGRRIPRIISAYACKIGRYSAFGCIAGRCAKPITETNVAKRTAGSRGPLIELFIGWGVGVTYLLGTSSNRTYSSGCSYRYDFAFCQLCQRMSYDSRSA